ncbi:MAG: exosortase/archaeosortase family protein [Nitrososphaerota archaeon]|jgi:exosortase/archaeosortase family protein|nr:exosortase/archaeosortase family protein [Nitrososphaerota archaeon]
MRLTRLTHPQLFLVSVLASILLPALIPRVGLDYPYLFIFMITIATWFALKWDAVKTLATRGATLEVGAGIGVISLDYLQNFIFGSRFGLIDMLVTFSAVVVAFFGIRAFKLFWVPATYGIVLLLGYQLENIIPNFVTLQDWLASVMVSALTLFGVTATTLGHLVAIQTSSGPMILDVQSDCTGIQGVLAFGMLSTMTILDIKKSWKRLIPLFIIGFVGVFLINILRLFVVFLTFEFAGIALGTTMHLFVGYILFVAWVMAFWWMSFKYMSPSVGPNTMARKNLFGSGI